jgi:hypothetical protein
MQDLMKQINYNISDLETKLTNFKKVYKELPDSNWLKKNEDSCNDHTVCDEGIVDELLHCQDISYNVNELFDFINTNNLNFVEWDTDSRFKYKYNIPNISYSNNLIQKYSINELFFGNIAKHSFLLSKNTNTKANINDMDDANNLNYKLILVMISRKRLNLILDYYKNLNTKEFELSISEYPPEITFNNISLKLKTKYSFKFIINEFIYTILKNIDNKRTLKELFELVRSELKTTITNYELLNYFKPVYSKFEMYDLILLKK